MGVEKQNYKKCYLSLKGMVLFNNIQKGTRFIIFLLLLGFLIPLTSFVFMSVCDKDTVNDCLYATRFVFSDFFYQYNTIRYIYHHGYFPSKLIVSDLGGEDGTESNGAWRVIYHSPLYYYFGAFLFLIAKKLNVSDLFLIYFASLVMFFFINLFFFFNARQISKQVYKKVDTVFIAYALLIFMFLPVHLHLSTGIQTDVAGYLLYIIAIFCYFKVLEYKDMKHSIILGAILGIGLLVRIATLIVIGGFILQMLSLHLRKEKKLRTCMLTSLLVSAGVGAYPFIRNIVLYNNPTGDMRAYLTTHKNIFYVILKVFRAFWGGISGGNDHIRLILSLFILILCVIVIMGIILYLKKHVNNHINLLLMIGLSTVLISLVFMCQIPYLLKYGACRGDIIQDRYLSPLNPLIAIFASIALVRVRGFFKNSKLRFLPDIFVVILALLLIIDFLTVGFYIN